MKVRFTCFTALACFAFSSFALGLDVNKASVTELMTQLKGVDPEIAQAIVDYRSQKQPLKTTDDLLAVAGVDHEFVAANYKILGLVKGKKELRLHDKEKSAVKIKMNTIDLSKGFR